MQFQNLAVNKITFTNFFLKLIEILQKNNQYFYKKTYFLLDKFECAYF